MKIDNYLLIRYNGILYFFELAKSTPDDLYAVKGSVWENQMGENPYIWCNWKRSDYGMFTVQYVENVYYPNLIESLLKHLSMP